MVIMIVNSIIGCNIISPPTMVNTSIGGNIFLTTVIMDTIGGSMFPKDTIGHTGMVDTIGRTTTMVEVEVEVAEVEVEVDTSIPG